MSIAEAQRTAFAFECKYRMFKAQYKTRSPHETWNILGIYNSEASAISSAMHKKKRGALLVRVIDKRGAVVFVY